MQRPLRGRELAAAPAVPEGARDGEHGPVGAPERARAPGGGAGTPALTRKACSMWSTSKELSR